MLSKVWNSISVTGTKWPFPKQTATSFSSPTKIDIRECDTPTATITASSIPITLLWNSWSYYWYLKVNYWINDNIDAGGTATQSNYDLMGSERQWTVTWNVSKSISLVKWDKLQIWFTAAGSIWQWSIWPFSVSYTIPLPKKWDYFWIPYSIKSIWELWFTHLFWPKQSSFYVWKEVSAATTWNITPGNFVGYIQLGKYKIPYYK